MVKRSHTCSHVHIHYSTYPILNRSGEVDLHVLRWYLDKLKTWKRPPAGNSSCVLLQRFHLQHHPITSGEVESYMQSCTHSHIHYLGYPIKNRSGEVDLLVLHSCPDKLKTWKRPPASNSSCIVLLLHNHVSRWIHFTAQVIAYEGRMEREEVTKVTASEGRMEQEKVRT